ncbi:MAG: amino acid ABC transporter permease, partial [Oxalobacteraceae bacterium]
MRSFGWTDFLFLLLAIRWTLVLSAGAFLFGGLLGLAIALMRVSGQRWLR